MAARIFKVAQARLIEVWNYSEKTWGIAQADKYLRGLVAAIETAQDEPHRWRPLRDDALPGISFSATSTTAYFFGGFPRDKSAY